jgi:hypothetical protein
MHVIERGKYSRFVRADQDIPSRLDQFDPLCRVAKRHARLIEEICFLLDATRIGDDKIASAFEREHLEIPNRVNDLDVRPKGQAKCVEGFSRARMKGQNGQEIRSLVNRAHD